MKISSFYLRCKLAVTAVLIPVISAFQTTTTQNTALVSSVEQAKELLDEYRGKPEDFVLSVSLTRQLTLQGKEIDFGLGMVIIADYVLKKDWMPNGFSDKDGVRYFKYKEL